MGLELELEKLEVEDLWTHRLYVTNFLLKFLVWFI
jgi:hypothetical protein